ncbi:MAG: cation diffusion facilitator family transporter [Candidatus Accumulibacter sp.]|jgi:cobalt-zinc-cadmium efflux system protein|nr:cation diffusion facilitator family transporter [Accumulibacter sp.]
MSGHFDFHGHTHHHSDHPSAHHAREHTDHPARGYSTPESGNRLMWALLATLGFAVIEVFSGIFSGSLALLGDAGHMATDGASLAMAALAAKISKRPPSRNHTFGLGRVETLAALLNVIFMIGIIAFLSVAAVRRFFVPQEIHGGTVTVVAVTGMFINILVGWLLIHGEQTLNTRGALLHVIGDLLGSLAALVAGIVIVWTGWTPIDPILSLLICALVLLSSGHLLRDVVHTLLEGVPPHLSVERIGRDLASIPGITSVHDLHIWMLSSNRVALSAHLVVDSLKAWQSILDETQGLLLDRGIAHVTLQPETNTRTIHWRKSLRTAARTRDVVDRVENP